MLTLATQACQSELVSSDLKTDRPRAYFNQTLPMYLQHNLLSLSNANTAQGHVHGDLHLGNISP